MTTTAPQPITFPFGEEEGLALSEAYAAARDTPASSGSRCPTDGPRGW